MKDSDIPEVKLISVILSRCLQDSAFRAALKKADNPDTEYQSWEYLASYGVNLEFAERRCPYTTVFSAAARSGRSNDGHLKFGIALLRAYENDRESVPAKSRLRRVLSCNTTEELCLIMRPVLKFIASKEIPISYGLLLRDLKYFGVHPDKTKASWAQQFFGMDPNENQEEAV